MYSNKTNEKFRGQTNLLTNTDIHRFILRGNKLKCFGNADTDRFCMYVFIHLIDQMINQENNGENTVAVLIPYSG